MNFPYEIYVLADLTDEDDEEEDDDEEEEMPSKKPVGTKTPSILKTPATVKIDDKAGKSTGKKVTLTATDMTPAAKVCARALTRYVSVR
jgi:hypothetical protein